METYKSVIKTYLHQVRSDGMMLSMNKFRLIVVALLLFSSLVPVAAFQFSPLEQEFSPTGAESTKTYTIVNDSSDTIAVEVSALTRELTINGTEENASAAAYFSIVPSKVLLRPQSSQIVRVQYRGPRTVPTELSFRLRAEQIPYTQGRTQENTSMFNFLYVYTTSLYITPARASEKVEVTSAAPARSVDGRQVLSLEITNTGTVHQILNDLKVEVIDNRTRKSVIYQGDALGVANGLNLLAGKKVRVHLAWPSTFEYPTTNAGTTSLFTTRISYGNQ